MSSQTKPLDIFITTWNTGLQGSLAQTQDLTSWLLPVLQQTNSADKDGNGGGKDASTSPPDIYAIGVQELLPVHLARTSYLYHCCKPAQGWSPVLIPV